MPAALEFLERAHRIERGAARALQTGLRPAEQRAAEGLTKTTLRRTWQRQRVVARLTEMTDRLGSLVQHQDTALEALSRLGPAVRDAAIRAMAVGQPALRQIAGPNARGGGRRQATARASIICCFSLVWLSPIGCATTTCRRRAPSWPWGSRCSPRPIPSIYSRQQPR
jgi:hypothetical protein